MKEISPTEAAQRLKNGSPLRLIDCREEEEYQLCRIEGAELMPVTRFGQVYAERLPDKNQPLLLYCHHGLRSKRACEFLLAKGYTQIFNLEGGIDRWSIEVDSGLKRY